MQQTGNMFVGLMCLVSLATATGVYESRNENNWYLRHDSEHKCDAGLPKRTTFGAGLLGYSYNPMKAAGKMGPELFSIVMNMSADCSTMEPYGYNTQRTRMYTGTVTTREVESLHGDEELKMTAMHAAVGGSLGSFGASVSASKAKDEEQSKRETMSRKYFLTSAQQVDNIFSFSEEAPPPLQPSFLQELQEWNDSRDEDLYRHLQLTDRVFTRRLFKKYGFFLKSAALGSSYNHIMTLVKSDIERVKKEDASFSVEAEVHSSFVSASGGYDSSLSNSDEAKLMMQNSTTVTHAVGSRIQKDQQFEETSISPGIVTAHYEPVCGVIPSSYSKLRELCYVALNIEKDAACLASLPDITQLSTFGQYDQIRNTKIAMSLMEQCEHMLFPMLGNELAFTRSDQNETSPGFRMVESPSTLFACARDCDLTGCVSYSFSGSTCKMCWAERVYTLSGVSYADCMGKSGSKKYVPESEFCVVFPGGTQQPPSSVGFCYDFVGCPSKERKCAAGLSFWPTEDPFTGEILRTQSGTSLGRSMQGFLAGKPERPLFTRWGSIVRGDILRFTTIDISREDTQWPSDRSKYMSALMDFKNRRTIPHLNKFNKVAAKLIMTATDSCLSSCEETDGCSLVFVELVPKRHRYLMNDVYCSMFSDARSVFSVEPEDTDEDCDDSLSCQLLRGALMPLQV